jgi:hypothetical protein
VDGIGPSVSQRRYCERLALYEPEDPLPHQRLDLMLDMATVAPVAAALGNPTHKPEAAIHLARQQPTRIRGDVATVEGGHDRRPLNRFKFEPFRATLRLHGGHRRAPRSD